MDLIVIILAALLLIGSISIAIPSRSSREISKIFEETIRGTVDECLLHFEKKEPKGEFVICLQGFKS